MKIGIYTITNKINNKIYVGYSINIERRFRQHKNRLLKNIHQNEYLQLSWNKYGENNFIFEILEECEYQFCATLEHYWCNLLNTHNKNFGYNLGKTSNSFDNKKYNNWFYGRKHSEETKRKLSLLKNNKKNKIYENIYENSEKEKIKRSLGVKKYWDNLTDKEKISRINKRKIVKTKDLSGGNNPFSKKVIINDILFPSISDAEKYFNVNRYFLYKNYNIIKLNGK